MTDYAELVARLRACFIQGGLHDDAADAIEELAAWKRRAIEAGEGYNRLEKALKESEAEIDRTLASAGQIARERDEWKALVERLKAELKDARRATAWLPNDRPF